MSDSKKETVLLNIIGYVIVGLFTLACLIPFLYTLSGSFTAERSLYRGIKLIPREFSLEGYRTVLQNPSEMINAYFVTIMLVLVGTVLSLFITTMSAYVLARKDFRYRSFFAFFFYFTTLFSGGLVPDYLLKVNIGLKDTFLVLMIPGFCNVFNMIITRSFFLNNVPMSLAEAAKIDGAGDFKIYRSIYMPVSKPILATVGLILAVNYWNDWYNAMLFINVKSLYPLQYYLYKILNTMLRESQLAETGERISEMPRESFKLAMTIFTMGPVILFYPFAQKYFVKGVTIGAIKE